MGSPSFLDRIGLEKLREIVVQIVQIVLTLNHLAQEKFLVVGDQIFWLVVVLLHRRQVFDVAVVPY